MGGCSIALPEYVSVVAEAGFCPVGPTKEDMFTSVAPKSRSGQPRCEEVSKGEG